MCSDSYKYKVCSKGRSKCELSWNQRCCSIVKVLLFFIPVPAVLRDVSQQATADSELELHSDSDCMLAARALTRWNVPTQCASVNTVRDLFKHAWLSFTTRYIRLI